MPKPKGFLNNLTKMKESRKCFENDWETFTDVQGIITGRLVMPHLSNQLPDDVLRHIMSFFTSRTGSISYPLSFYKKKMAKSLKKMMKYNLHCIKENRCLGCGWTSKCFGTWCLLVGNPLICQHTSACLCSTVVNLDEAYDPSVGKIV